MHLIKPMAAAVSGKTTHCIWARYRCPRHITRRGSVYLVRILILARFTGVRLFRDMQMLPNSETEFYAVGAKFAQTNALVTIEQNGFVVYQKRFLGPFSIADLQLAGGGADRCITIA